MTTLQVNQINWAIQCASRRIEPIVFAISELCKYMKQITGSDIPINEDPQSPAAGDQSKIIIGLRSDLPPQDQSLLPSPAKGFDGYAISIISDATPSSARIIIGAHSELGAVYAVYDLLERMGCRWFYPRFDIQDPEVVPRGEDAKLETAQWAIASPFQYRIFIGVSHGEESAEYKNIETEWALKCRFNMGKDSELATRCGLLPNGGGHSFGDFLKTEDYFEQHPEWFGLQNGKRQPHIFGGSQFCWSNAEARKTFVENFGKYIEAHPEIGWYGLFGGDGLPACQCDECKTLNPADWQIQIVNEAMARVEKVSPNLKIITAGAYAPVDDPPLKIRPDSRILCTWAHWGRHHGESFDNPNYSLRNNLGTWCDLFDGRIVPFQYYSDHFAEPWVAAPYASTIMGDRKYLVERGAIGFSNLLYPPGYWWNWSLNNYMSGLCFYDEKSDAFDIIRDYATKYFGEKAGAFLKAYYIEWAKNLDLAYHVRDGASQKDATTLADQRNRFIEPALAAVKSDPTMLYRVSKLEKLHALAERLVEIQLVAKEIESFRAQRNFEKAAEKVAKARRCSEQTEAFARSLIDLNQGLVDQQLLDHFYPRIRAAIEQQAEMVEKKSRETSGTARKNISPADMVPNP